jgi:hypothetical protein
VQNFRELLRPRRERPRRRRAAEQGDGGTNLIKITDVTGHCSLEDMLKTYSRDAEAFVDHAGGGLP